MYYDELATLIRKCEAEIMKGNLDQAEDLLNYIGKANNNSDSEDDDYDEDVSNPSMDAADDDDDGEDDDEDDGDEAELDKLLRKATVPERSWIHNHQNATSPVKSLRNPRARGYEQTADSYRLSAAEGPGKRHRFISRVEHIADRDGVSKTEATTRARREFPETYTDFQDHLSRRSNQPQQMVRGYHGTHVGKAAASSYEELVSAEIRKGCSMEIASQRVAQAHGFRALDSRIMKSSNLAARFQKRVDRIAEELGCDLTEACQIARRADPLLFKAMQIV
jgi:hypothetical protein